MVNNTFVITQLKKLIAFFSEKLQQNSSLAVKMEKLILSLYFKVDRPIVLEGRMKPFLKMREGG